MELAVHQRHLEFVLEVADRPETADYHRRPNALGVRCQETIERFEGHSRVGAACGPKHVEALFDLEKRLLGDVDRYRHYEAIAKR
jgi:hypothetical protein